MNTITIDGVVWAVDPDTGEITDDIVGYEGAPRDDTGFQVTDESSAQWVVAKLREAEAEIVAAEEAMEQELQAVRRGWTRRMRRAASKARWLRDNYQDGVCGVMLPLISRGKSVHCGAGTVGLRTVRHRITITDPLAYQKWAVAKRPELLDVQRLMILETNTKLRAAAVKKLEALRKIGVAAIYTTTATQLLEAEVYDAPGTQYEPAREEVYVRTGIKLSPSAKGYIDRHDAEEVEA